jgi:hypothetical protein
VAFIKAGAGLDRVQFSDEARLIANITIEAQPPPPIQTFLAIGAR